MFQNCSGYKTADVARFAGQNLGTDLESDVAPTEEDKKDDATGTTTPPATTTTPVTTTPMTTTPTTPVVTCKPTRHYQKSVSGNFRLSCQSPSNYQPLFPAVQLNDTGEVVAKVSFTLVHDSSVSSNAHTGMISLAAGAVGGTYFNNYGYGAVCPAQTGSYQTFAYGKLSAGSSSIAIGGRAYGNVECANGGNASNVYVTNVVIDAWVEDSGCTGDKKKIYGWSYQKESLQLGHDRPVYAQTSATAVLKKSVVFKEAAPVIAFAQNYATRTPTASSGFGAVVCGAQTDTAASIFNAAGAQTVHTDVFSASQGQSHVMLSHTNYLASASAGTHAFDLYAAVNQAVSVGHTVVGILNSGDSTISVIKGPFEGKSW